MPATNSICLKLGNYFIKYIFIYHKNHNSILITKIAKKTYAKQCFSHVVSDVSLIKSANSNNKHYNSTVGTYMIPPNMCHIKAG